MPFLKNKPKIFDAKVAIRSLCKLMQKSSMNEKIENKSVKSHKYNKIKIIREKVNNPFIHEE